MLHILWMIIKFILIVSGVLLALLLLALLLILFCPVRYRAAAVKEDEDFRKIRAEAAVSWLFHGITVKIRLEDRAVSHSVKIFGISLERLTGFLNKLKNRGRKDRAKKARKRQKASPSPADGSKPEPVSEPESITEIPKPDTVPQETDTPVISETSEIPDSDTAPQEAVAEPKAGIFSKFRNRIYGIPEKLKGLRKIPETFRKIALTIRSIYAKIDWWKQFLTHPRTKEAFSLVRGTLIRLLKHVFPTRIEGKLTFGSEDPSITGMVLALLGMTMPLHKNCVEVCPVFEGINILEGNVRLKGRIYGIVFLKAAIQIYFNKNIKYVIHRWKHKEGNL